MPARQQTLELLASVIGDKYEVIQWIGGGGMADVYLARHRMHGGLAAVKVLADHLAGDRNIVERFLQEARTAASLSGHANIVTIFDVGENQGLHYLIMQYVEGEDLGTCLERRGRLEPWEAVQVMTQVTKALVWAHSKKVVHRDLKPNNIRLDQNGRVIVLDFGIAKAGTIAVGLTGLGEKLGTPLYMAPEQIRGETCDGRTDLYSLGLMFYEMLTGQRPFGGENYHAIQYAQIHTPARSPAEVAPTTPEPHCRIVLRLLEKDPEDRYQTAEEVLAELKKLDAGRGTIVMPRPEEWRPPAGALSEAPEVKTPPATPRRETGPEETTAPPTPAPMPVRGGQQRTWLIFGGGIAVIAVALGVAVFSGGSKPPSGPKESAPRVRRLFRPSARVQTPTGAMVLVAGAEFGFGEAGPESPNPPRTVALGDYYVDETEVSNGAYQEFCQATRRALPQPPQWDPKYVLAKPDHPVVNVTLADAQAFAQWAGKRLPSEEEWEKAARGTDGRIYPWGTAPPAAGQANLGGAEDGFEYSAPVESLPEGASPYGARHLAGNVWEWTLSPYPVTPREIADMKALLPFAGEQWGVIKGGSFAPQTGELWARAYMRRGFPVDGKSPYIGFRCVKDAK